MKLTQAEADPLAASLLAVKALEARELDIEAIVIPWLDVGEIVQFVDPGPQVSPTCSCSRA